MENSPAQAVLSIVEADKKPPLYQQIYLLIRDRIITGEYPDQSLLPTEDEAAKLFAVSRITVKRALNEIAADGLCIRKRGQGSRVTYKLAGAPLKSDTQGLLDALSDAKISSAGEILEFDYKPAEARIAAILGVDENVEVQRSVRVRYHEGKPMSYLTTYVPADLGRRYESHHLLDQAVLTLLEQTGVEVTSADQNISATLAAAVGAEALEVKQGAPLLRIRRIVRDRDNRVVEYIIGLYRPDSFQYSMSLSRINDGSRQFWSVD